MAENPQVLLQRLVELALELCQAGTAGISLMETPHEGRGTFRWITVSGMHEARAGTSTPAAHSACGVTLEHGAAQLFSYPGRHFTYLDELEPPIVEGLVIPLSQANPRGTIWILSHDERRKFDAEDLRVLTGIAQFAAGALYSSSIADHNAQLYARAQAEIAERTRAEALLQCQKRMLEMVAGGDTLTQVLEFVVRTVETQCGGEFKAGIMLLDEDGEHLRHGAALSLPAGYLRAVDGAAICAGIGPCSAAVARVEPVVIADLYAEPEWSAFRKLAAPYGLRAAWSTPIVSPTHKVLGSFCAYYARPNKPGTREQRFIDGVVHTAALAIERLRTEEALRKAHGELEARVAERTRELVEANAMYRAIYDQGLFAGILTTEGMLIDANRHALETTSFTRADVVGKPFWDTGWWNRRAEVQAWLKAGFAQAVEGRPFHGESIYFHANGSEHVVDHAFMPIKDAAGTVEFIVATGLDVTDRKQAEQQRKTAEVLRESEARFRDIANDSPAMLWITEPDGTCSFLSRSWYEFTGQTEAEGLGYGWFDAVHPNDRGLARHTYKAANSNHEPYALDYRVRERNGEYRWAIDAGRPRFGANGEFLGYVGMVIDITQRKRAEDALRKSEMRFRQFADNSANALWIIDADKMQLEYLSPAYERIWGEPRDAAMRDLNRWAELLHPEDREHALATMPRLLAGEVLALEYRILRAGDGAVRWVFDTGFPIPDEQGHIGRIGGFAQDITERKQAEERLRESEERLKLAHETAGLGSWRLDLATGQMAASAGCKTNFGRSSAENLTYADVLSAVHPDDRDRMRKAVARAIEERAVYDIEYRVYWPNGELHWILARGRCIDAARGEAAQMIGVTMDITARRRAEDALRESEERFRQFAENSADVLWIVDAKTQRLEYLSPAFERIWGEPRDAVMRDIGRWAELLHPEDRESAMAGMPRLLAGEVFANEYRIVRPSDGAVRWIFDTGFPIPDEQGRVRRAAGIAQDITERKQAQDALVETDRRKDEFLATLAHELRNPLAPLRNSLEILYINDSDRKGVSRLRESMEQQVDHLTRLVDDLLEVSRITRGKIELRKEHVEMAVVTRSTVDNWRTLIIAASHDFNVTFPSEPLYVHADPVRLNQVIANLLDNATKYTEPGGQIDLTVERDGDDAVLKVRDTGIGISKQALPLIFDMFAQARNSSPHAPGGLGIGLTLVKRILELHGGTVEARSRGPGRGSEFIVRLPLAAGAPPLAASEQPAADAAPASPCNILVVDDNPAAADTLAELLNVLGNEVQVAYDGSTALDVFEDWRPDVMLLDIGMPGMSGYEVARRVRRQPRSDGVILIAVTGWGQEHDRRLSHEAGFDHHLLKPLDLKSLRAVLATRPQFNAQP